MPNVVKEYKKFGMTTLDGRTYGPSVTLGGVDINLLDVTYGYSVLAGGGVMRGVPTTKAARRRRQPQARPRHHPADHARSDSSVALPDDR